MNKATEIMEPEIEKLNFSSSKKNLVSNVTAKLMKETPEIKNLLIKQIESRVKWRESVKYMIQNGTNSFIEIGPGKVLSGLIKRIDRNVKLNQVNNLEDLKILNDWA